MPHITKDRVLETTTTTGTGAITLAAAVTGFRRFNAVCAVGDTLPYFIEAIDSLGAPTGDYEYGIGTYSGANALTRTKIEGSSNAGAAVNFTTGMPTGARVEMTGSVVPDGYLELNGALISRLQYPALWAYAQGVSNMAASDGAWTKGQYSPGDGATTFRIPDHRGYHMRAWDNGAGVDAGRVLGSIQNDQLLAHTHSVTGTTDAQGSHSHTSARNGTPTAGGNTSGFAAASFDGNNNAPIPTTSDGNHAHNVSGTAASTGGAENRVKTIAVLVCVKT
jgi:microcystin-dependent protein